MLQGVSSVAKLAAFFWWGKQAQKAEQHIIPVTVSSFFAELRTPSGRQPFNAGILD